MGPPEVPFFHYKAARDHGEVVEGQIEASNTRAAAQRLRAEGQVPLQIVEAGAAGESALRPAQATPGIRLKLGRSGLNNRDIELFTLQLSTLLRAGLSLGQALETLARLAEKPEMQSLGKDLNQSIRHGEPLSDALRQSSPLFDRFYLNMVKAGESTGALDLALESLAIFKTRAREMREALISALIYPGILLTLALVAVAIMLAFVVPQFTEMFQEAGQDLPLLTQIVAGAGELITGWWWAMLLALTAGVYLLRRSWQHSEGKEKRDRILLKMPLLGTLLLKIETARFTGTLSTLLANGVSLLTAMDIAKEIVSNRIVAQALERTATRVRQGEGLSKPLSETRVFPSLATQLIQVGERSGHLEPMLERVSQIYESEVDTNLKRLLGLVEPVIIIFIALFVSVIILSIVMLILASNDIVF